MTPQHLAQRFRDLATFIDLAGPLLNSTPQATSPAAAAPSPGPPAPSAIAVRPAAPAKAAEAAKPKAKPAAVSKKAKAKRKRKPAGTTGAPSPKFTALRAFYLQNPGASVANARRAVGAAKSLAFEVRRQMIEAGELPARGQREGESDPSPAGEDGSTASDDEPDEYQESFERYRSQLGLAPAVEADEEPPPCTKKGKILPHGTAMLARVKGAWGRRALKVKNRRRCSRPLAERIRGLVDHANLTHSQIAERLDEPPARVKRCCLDHDIPFKGIRKANLADSPLWDLPAELVELAEPKQHAEMQHLIYSVRAPAVREKMKKMRLRKGNCYPVNPIVFERINARELMPNWIARDRF